MKKIIKITLLLLLSFATKAQDVATDEIEVVKPYQPILADAVKISFSPTIPINVIEKPTYTYLIPTKLIAISTPPPDLKPVAFSHKRLSTIVEKNGYAKLGYGMYNTPYVKLGAHYSPIKELEIGLVGEYISSKSARLQNQQSTRGSGGIFVNKKLSNELFSLNTNYTTSTFHYYGYDNKIENFDKNEVRQTSSIIDLKIAAKSANDASTLQHEAAIGLSSIVTTSKCKEILMEANASISKVIFKKHTLVFPFRLKNSSYSDSLKLNNLAFSLGPQLNFVREKGNLYAGVEVGMVNKKFGIYPYTKAMQVLIKDKLIFETSWSIDWQHNSYHSMMAKNPWLSDDNQLLTTITQNRMLGVKGRFKSFGYELNVLQQVVKNQLVFNNKLNDLKKIAAIYIPSTTILNVGGKLDYTKFEMLQLSWSFYAMQYETDSGAYAWHLPSFETNVTVQYMLNDKIKLIGALIGLGSRRTTDGIAIVKLAPVVDMSAECMYKINKNFYAFVQFNNLLNQRYQIYNKYEIVGFQALGGVKILF